MGWRSWLLVAAVMLLVAGGTRFWQARPADAGGNAFALTHQVMSPYCPGLTLAACPSGSAADLRAEIAARVKAGESSTAILDDLARRFGPAIRGVPTARGSGLLLWVVPALLGVIGAWGVLAAGRQRTEAAPAEPAVPLTSTWSARLDDELADAD
ncbi:MAG TPA: cytochrome c-type biogenesis protein CcmH [Luteitalea sp.]|nr:cytochrome c-type biogenesis protein CcmH [Luteitalea sp.]